MTTATRKTETEKMTIEITLTRKVNDKVAYMDGYNLKTGREVYENYEVKITGKVSGKIIRTSGKPDGFAFFETASKFQKMPAGAYARVGDAYVTKETYDIAMSMISELDAEVTKTNEQVSLENAETLRQKIENKALDLEAAEYASQIKNCLCQKCGTYCYGDCEVN